MKIGFLGAGNMGKAIIDGLLNTNAFTNENIKVVINSDKSFQYWNNRHISVSKQWEFLRDCEIIILALTPQDILKLKEQLTNLFTQKIIISVASGINMTLLKTIFKDCEVTRVMPNTSCQFNNSMTMICEEGNVIANEQALNIFNYCGKTISLSEKQIHLFIAICGNASGYLYHWLQPLIEIAENNNLSKDEAKTIVGGLLLGVATNILNSDLELKKLQENVTSPDGTTMAAIKVFETNNLQNIISDAVNACMLRSKQLEDSI
ncbi:pyrroline-5-carboxylate reductase [Spiroplasma endosymbiont of Nephrotoma flavescens]|uniref:pyrroline-5-carboxylate reductase family protein n=1 Tax=Spiroplasma endosymbiont of Nephrotoma flavescens TaxID=3066302 RepID=UPI00313E78B6